MDEDEDDVDDEDDEDEDEDEDEGEGEGEDDDGDGDGAGALGAPVQLHRRAAIPKTLIGRSKDVHMQTQKPHVRLL